MALLSWSPQYVIGHETIDAEHKELFRQINEFHDRWQAGRSREEIARVLTELIAYAENHFQHEEAIMREHEYPLLDDHAFIHERMVETIFELRQDFEAGHQKLEIQTLKFVRNWLVDHIATQDYQFRSFLARRKSADA